MKNKEKDLQVEAYNENNPPTNEQVVEEQIQAKEEVESVTDHDEVDANDTAADKEFLETSAEAVGYENRESQWNTYRVMASYLDPEYSILDFGCARGDFRSFYLSEFQTDLEYTGLDFNPQLIDAGKKVNPDTNIIHADWRTYRGEPADWCINIGSHDVRYDADMIMTDMEYLMKTIEQMYNNCTMGLSVMLASDTMQQDEGIITWSAGDVLNNVLAKFGTASLDHSYSDAIFTLIIYKNS